MIGDGALLGIGAILLDGVRLGRCAVVAAGAVVTRDVPDFSVVAGNPARVLRKLDPNASQVRDPECGAAIDPAASTYQISYQGTRYHFCCASCHDRFQFHPPSGPEVPASDPS